MAPAEVNPTALQVVEVAPGDFRWVTPADAEAFAARRAADEAAAAAYQATLAGEATPTETLEQGGVLLTVLTKAELVELAEKRGLKTSGSKDAIAARFAPNAEPDDDEDDDEVEDGAAG